MMAQSFTLNEIRARALAFSQEWKDPQSESGGKQSFWDKSAFGFLTGHTFKTYEDAPEVNIKAARHMADLHDALKKNGYTDHSLAVLMVRLMFCMFADHTGLFPRQLFRDIILRRTDPSGVDVGPMIQQIFAVLDTPPQRRQKNLDEDLASFRHVNGLLFKDRFDPPAFDVAGARRFSSAWPSTGPRSARPFSAPCFRG